jgi:hypothetical protein
MSLDRRKFIQVLAAGSAVGLAAGGAGSFKVRQTSATSPTGQALNPSSAASSAAASTMVQPYSYIVFYDSTAKLYNAVNGTTGTTDYSGTNAATVIQSALSGAPTGGSVYIQVGTYTGTGSVTNTNGLSIIAQGGAVFSGFTMPAFARMPSILTRHNTLTPNGPFDGGDFGPNSQ